MTLSLTEVIALRRLARMYRRILVLAVPAALAGCQDSGDVLAPESAGAPVRSRRSSPRPVRPTPSRV
jgi:hypothetical protein